MPRASNFITKETREIFKNTFFIEHLWWLLLKKIIEFFNHIESLLKTNLNANSSILVSVLLRTDYIKSENIFYSDIFKHSWTHLIRIFKGIF